MTERGDRSHGSETPEVRRLMFQRNDRWYLDLRSYCGGRPALKPPGEPRATTDIDIAIDLATKILHDVRAGRTQDYFAGIRTRMSVGELAHAWLEAQYALGVDEAGPATTARYAVALEQLFADQLWNGAPAEIALDPALPADRLTPAHVQRALATLRKRPSRKGGTLGETSLHHVVVAMKLAYDFGAERYVVPKDSNPWGKLKTGRAPRRQKEYKTDCLEGYEVAALLQTLEATAEGARPVHAIAMVLAYTGARLSEVLGLRIADIDLLRDLIYIAPNEWRTVKSGDERSIRIWRDLKPVLRDVLRSRGLGPSKSRLLFPAEACDANGREQMWRPRFTPVLMKALPHAAKLLGPALGPKLLEKYVTAKVFRVSYCSARCQTTDGDRPVAMLTVMAELGHSDFQMIKRIYGRVLSVRMRRSEISYQLDDAHEALRLLEHGVDDDDMTRVTDIAQLERHRTAS